MLENSCHHGYNTQHVFDVVEGIKDTTLTIDFTQKKKKSKAVSYVKVQC